MEDTAENARYLSYFWKILLKMQDILVIFWKILLKMQDILVIFRINTLILLAMILRNMELEIYLAVTNTQRTKT